MLKGKSGGNKDKLCSTTTYDCLLILTTAALIVSSSESHSVFKKIDPVANGKTNLEFYAAELPDTWTVDVLDDLEYKAVEWSFESTKNRQIVIKMPDGNYLIWRLLQDPFRFEMEPVTNPKTLPESKLFRDLHMAFHELEAKYMTLVKLIAGEEMN